MDAIFVESLSKNFGNFEAVKGISFSIKEGELFGLLGPNGAGKTTTLAVLSTMLLPSSGKAIVNGFDVQKNPDMVRKSIGMVFQDSSLDLDLTAKENLAFHAELYGVPKKDIPQKIENALLLVGLKEFSEKQVKTFSGGMKRRLEISRGLMHAPKVLFLDEPTLGLDIQTRRNIWDYVKKLSKENKMTIILTTHYLEEADFLCDRIAIIDSGKIVAMGSPQELKDSVKGEVVKVKTSDSKKLLGMKIPSIKSSAVNGEVYFTVENAGKFIPVLLKAAQETSVDVESVELHRVSLDDVFVRFTGHFMRAEEIDTKNQAMERMRQMHQARR